MKKIAFTLFLLINTLCVFSQTPSTPKYHTVAAQETLYRIATNAGITVEQLKKWNNLSSNTISVGQKLIIGYTESLAEGKKESTSNTQGGSAVCKFQVTYGVGENSCIYCGQTIHMNVPKRIYNISGPMEDAEAVAYGATLYVFFVESFKNQKISEQECTSAANKTLNHVFRSENIQQMGDVTKTRENTAKEVEYLMKDDILKIAVINYQNTWADCARICKAALKN